ncbi:hypothetical protein [Saccharothrix yanglingensis]|uniref:Uncharacterized protein n=1 Tax=Saccharothrix yanglingensis TaxID=659496 RepID=A0ABU0X965_9PSEU|nr:hypothetical protein [Saccharothrix yanglingensis]MDQ2587744.1 hypothetical protein [Saccharothrix yanglingensis]
MDAHDGEEDDFEPEEPDEFDDEEDVENEDDLFGVTSDARTICHLCGGAGFIANPTAAVISGTPRTVDNGRECPHCNGARKFPGLVPPV